MITFRHKIKSYLLFILFIIESFFSEYKLIDYGFTFGLGLEYLANTQTVDIALRIGKKESFLWVVRPGLAKFFKLPTDKDEIIRIVTKLRKSLNSHSEHRPFDLKTASYLYDLLLKPAEPYFNMATHLLIVPNGPLESLPMGLLVKQLDRISDNKSEDRSIDLIPPKLQGIVMESQFLEKELTKQIKSEKKARSKDKKKQLKKKMQDHLKFPQVFQW